MNKTFFIADLHFGHVNALSFDNRPYGNIKEHDEALINNWNSVVGVDDTVWILGDISWYSASKTTEILKQLNGKKCLCKGNHDGKLVKSADFRKQFEEICDYKEITIGNDSIVLCHYPIPCYRNHYYGWVHLYGHVHTGFEWGMMERTQYEMTCLYDKQSNMINVGCMTPYIRYTPQTLEQIIVSYQKYKEF